MSYFSYPEISMPRGIALLQALEEETIEDLRLRAGTQYPDVEPPVRGDPAPKELEQKLSEVLRDLAIETGYPSTMGRRAEVRAFDRPAGAVLHDLMRVSPADASRPEIWNYVSLVLLPDVAMWRFPSRESYRILGAGFGDTANRKNRNAFGRLWWAVEVLGHEARLETEDEFGQPLGEDELVGIMERTSSIAPSPIVARTLASRGRSFYATHRNELRRVGIPNRSEFFRELSKQIPRKRAVVNISALSEVELGEVIEAACLRVSRHLEE